MPIVITDDDVRRLLSMPECIEAMRTCFRDFAEGEAVSLPRLRYSAPTSDPGRAYFANVHVGAVPSMGTACVRAGSHLLDRSGEEAGRRRKLNLKPNNYTVVILYDLDTSEPKAFMHESYVSGLRVGATSGLAVSEMARDDASVLGLFGTGRQAFAHCQAISAVRPIRAVRVFSPNPEHLTAFVDRATAAGMPVAAARGPEEVVDGADIVCTNTNSTEPVVKGAWLTPGQMVINIANSDQTGVRREVDEETFLRADAIVVTDWDSVFANNQVELTELLDNGKVNPAKVHTLGDVVAGRAQVKSTTDNIIYYKNNTGLAMQFAAAGAIVCRKLLAEGTNRVIPDEWLASEQYGIG
jgi:alanine dehydrogenase